MKKLLIVLMIVAMASFLFVGCFGTTPPIDPDEPEPGPVIPATEAPIITEISGVSFTSALAQYTNKIEVSGIAPTGSVIRIYVNGVNTGMGYVGLNGLFKKVSGTSLATVLDGAKTLYATATEFGLAESAPSTTYSFTYDTTAPKILKAVADAGKKFITVTFDEAVNTSLSDTTSTTLTWAKSAVNGANWTITHTGFTATGYLAISNKVIRITGTGLTGGGAFATTCTGISDLLGNAIKATAPSTYIGIVIPAAPVVPAVTPAEAVIAVRNAAIVLDLAVWITASDIVAFLDALADTNFTGYVAANDNAYVTAAVAGNFSAVTTVALVNAAIAVVNTAAPAPVAVTGVTLDQATMTLTAGGATGALVATVAPATATDTSVTWSSSAPAVATVVDGVVIPLTEGIATITVTTVDGSFTATCAVTITAAPIVADLTDYNAALAAVTETDYTTASWTVYQLIVAANVVTEQNTQAEVFVATAAITTAQAAYLVLVADLTNYNAALAAVTEADYTVASWDIYQLIVDANVVTEQDTQVDVDTATAAITTAQIDLVLVADLTNYNAALAAVTETDYTPASWDIYQLIVAANVVTEQNSQAIVDAATLAITTAQGALVTIITDKAIPGVTPPVVGTIPDITPIVSAQYTGTITWVPAVAPAVVDEIYTATITLIAEPGYTLIGVAENFFTVAGTDPLTPTTNSANLGVVTATFLALP